MTKRAKAKTFLSQWSRSNLSNKSMVKVNFCQVNTLTAVSYRPTVCMRVTPLALQRLLIRKITQTPIKQISFQDSSNLTRTPPKQAKVLQRLHQNA